MKRHILAVIAGFVTWIVVVSLLNRVLRFGVAGYAAAEPAMAFTLGMMAARLAIAALTSVVAGAVVGRLARPGRYTGWILGGILLALFVPEHLSIWSRFPLWYHLTFLGTLAPLVALGALFTDTRAEAAQPQPM